MTFQDIDFDQPAVRPASEVKRKGKKSISYTDDPEILARLALVARLMLMGKPAYKIAEELKESLGTAKLDMARVRSIWRKESRGKISAQRDEALAQYRLTREKAWDLIDKNPDKAERFLPLVLASQERIDKVVGNEAPDRIDLSGTVKVRDIEQVRQKRWQQIAGELKDALEE